MKFRPKYLDLLITLLALLAFMLFSFSHHYYTMVWSAIAAVGYYRLYKRMLLPSGQS